MTVHNTDPQGNDGPKPAATAGEVGLPGASGKDISNAGVDHSELQFRPEWQTAARYATFRADLIGLINAHSIENGSDTPDFLLADYLMSCLDAWERITVAREEWYGRKPGEWT